MHAPLCRTNLCACLMAVLALVFAATSSYAQPGASTTVTLDVPPSMRTAPFNVTRTLDVPAGYTAEVFARVPGARFMAFAPNGDLLVSQPGAGRVRLLRDAGGAEPTQFDFLTGLRNPHDIVFHTLAGTTYVYVSESHQINRYVYTYGATTPGPREIVVANLPDASSPELGGAYGHQLKNIALAGNTLYVAIASATNASPSDTTSDPVRCAVYRYTADGQNRRLFATGLRNAEGLAVLPGSNQLWVTVNSRDNLRYPWNDGAVYNGLPAYGQVIPSYVDNNPPDLFTRVRPGKNYGWPFANPRPRAATNMSNLPLAPDYDNNRDWSLYPASTFTRPSKGIQAHSAPLGFVFLHRTAFDPAYRRGAAIALHGSWNRTVRTGYKVVYFPFTASTKKPGVQRDLVTGWLNDATQETWGRPVDVAVDRTGGLYISDDAGGAIYRVAPAPAITDRITGFTLINADTDQPIVGYAPIQNGQSINLADLPTRNLSIRADTNPPTVGSVVFSYQNAIVFRTVNERPYALTDAPGGDYAAWTPSVGAHTVSAIPYNAADAVGGAGTPLSTTFYVVDQP